MTIILHNYICELCVFATGRVGLLWHERERERGCERERECECERERERESRVMDGVGREVGTVASLTASPLLFVLLHGSI